MHEEGRETVRACLAGLLARNQPIRLDVRFICHSQKLSDRVEVIRFLSETPAILRMLPQVSHVRHQAPCAAMLRRTIASILSSSDKARSTAARSAASIRAIRSLAAVILRGLRNLSIRHQRRVKEVGPAPKQTSLKIASHLALERR